MAYTSIHNATTPTASAGLAADAQSLGALKRQAAAQTAIKETAKQFESLFMRELIKSMREATVESGMLDSPGGDLGTDMLDQQFAVQTSGQPGGLSDTIALQLSRQMGLQSPQSRIDRAHPHALHGLRVGTCCQCCGQSQSHPHRKPNQFCAKTHGGGTRGGKVQRHPCRLHARPGRARNRLGQA